jgi:hypothetical protein
VFVCDHRPPSPDSRLNLDDQLAVRFIEEIDFDYLATNEIFEKRLLPAQMAHQRAAENKKGNCGWLRHVAINRPPRWGLQTSSNPRD